MKKFIASIIFALMIPSLVFGGQAVPVVETVAATETVLTAADLEQKGAMLVAQAKTTDAASAPCVPCPEVKASKSHSWDNFWDVHFGGYRWAWWALAGGALIAIHAGN